MKIIPFGRGGSFDIYSDRTWENGQPLVLGNKEWDEIEVWCRKAKIYYGRTGNTIQFFKDSDVTAFMLRFS